VIEGIIRPSLYVDHIDATLTSLPGGITGRSRKVALRSDVRALRAHQCWRARIK